MPHSLDEKRAGPRPGQAAHGGRGDAKDDLRPGIFAQESKADAEAQWDTVADALREKNEKLGALMDASRDDVLAYMTFPREHWAQVASTNPLERVNREIKRRADVIGIFPNDEAIVRLVGALMLETNDEWAVARRYMSLESLARVTDTLTVRLPAVAS
jgi:transposase-like protein